MNVQFYMAARARIVYGNRQKLAAVLLDKSDENENVLVIEEAYKQWLGGSTKSPLDAIELLIAKMVDDGEELPVSNRESFLAAKWISAQGLAALPDEMPRAFVLYLAKGLAENGQYATMTLALKDILATKTFTNGGVA